MKNIFVLFLTLFTIQAHASNLIVTENIDWLYNNKVRSYAAVRDRNHPDSLLATNIVFSTWAMADASINADVAPFMAELWISRLDDVLHWFQVNHKSSFERWLRIQEGMLFSSQSEKETKELENLKQRLIAHLAKHSGKLGFYGELVRKYLEVLKKVNIQKYY